MVSKRDRFIKLQNYFESLGITVNVGKNKARGNKGLFIAKNNKSFRIDISSEIDESSILSIMLHEFAHYVHYRYDSSLKSLDFIFDEISNEELEELLQVTVDKVPKEAAVILYNKKNEFNSKIKKLTKIISNYYPEFKISKPFKEIEKSLSLPAKYLLKYDRVKYFNKIYSVEYIERDFKNMPEYQYAYIRLKSLQRHVMRINAKINKFNKYYNSPTELWARFCELFFMNQYRAVKLAPKLSVKFINCINSCKIKELSEVNKILQVSN